MSVTWQIWRCPVCRVHTQTQAHTVLSVVPRGPGSPRCTYGNQHAYHCPLSTHLKQHSKTMAWIMDQWAMPDAGRPAWHIGVEIVSQKKEGAKYWPNVSMFHAWRWCHFWRLQGVRRNGSRLLLSETNAADSFTHNLWLTVVQKCSQLL